MKETTPQPPLRGEAAWRAELKEIGARNEAARAAGQRRRAQKEREVLDEAVRLARRESQQLRDQPGR